MIDKLIEFIKKKELDISSFFLLYSLVKEDKSILQLIPKDEIISAYFFLQSMKLIKVTNFVLPKGEVRQAGIDLINEAEKLLKSDIPVKKKEVSNDISEWIEGYRDLFKGTKVGAKGDRKACLEKMIRFFETYPEYANKDLIFKATENYIKSEAVNSNYKYLQRADYFIFKKTDKEDTSRLASFCDEVNDSVDDNSNILDLN